MLSAKEINPQIIAVFTRWCQELRDRHPHLFSGAFSNVFCPGITEEWGSSTMRILIIGEEATWKGRDHHPEYTEDELQKCQKWIVEDLEKQLGGTVARYKSPFWRRIHALHEAFPQAAFCWANIDCINADTRRALAEKDRQALHDCHTRPARELVELVAPTHILFCGWHNTSLRHEFPELCEVVYPRRFGDTRFMKKNGYILKTDYRGIPTVFTYHPSWLKANSDSYIKRLIDTLTDK